MHAIITCNALNFTVDAGRRFSEIQNLPNYFSIEVSDKILGFLDSVQVNSPENSQVAQSVSTLEHVKTINRLEGLAMLEGRKAHLAQEEPTIAVPLAGLAPISNLKHVKTVNRLEGLAMLERRKAHLTWEEFIVAPDLAPVS
jgi:hypothetical protein